MLPRRCSQPPCRNMLVTRVNSGRMPAEGTSRTSAAGVAPNEAMIASEVFGLIGQFDDEPLGAPADRSREVEMGGGRRAARQDEGPKRRQLLVERVDLLLEPRDLDLGHREPRAAGTLALLGRAEIGAEIEQVILDAYQHGVDGGRPGRVQARKSDRGVGLLRRAAGGD